MSMGEYIRQLRKEHGLSQGQLGEIVGVNRAAVQKWEKGSVENIKRSTIKKLADYFQVSPCELMQWENSDKSDLMQQEQKCCDLFEKCYGKDAYHTVEMYLKLDNYDRGSVAGEIKQMLKQDKYAPKKESSGGQAT